MIKKVFIDPGHGGADGGAVAKDGTKEKDRVLEFSLILGKEFEKQDIMAYYSREKDERIYLSQRCEKERSLGADLCISCHMDAAASSASGATALLHSKAPQSYIVWAEDMIEAIEQVGMTSNRANKVQKGYMGSQNQDYYFNANTNSPSMILELGFITNPINLAEHIEKAELYAKAVVKASCKFLGVEYKEETELEEVVEQVEDIEPIEETPQYKVVTLEDLFDILRDQGIGSIHLS